MSGSHHRGMFWSVLFATAVFAIVKGGTLVLSGNI